MGPYSQNLEENITLGVWNGMKLLNRWPIILKMEENRYAKVELAGSNETKPAKVLHAKLSIGTSPESSKFEGKKCKGSVLKKGRF